MADRSESWKKYIPSDSPQKDNRSDYLKARAHAGNIDLNFCPFGCEDRNCDDKMRCKHLIGHTHQPEHEGDRPKTFSPLKYQRSLDGTIQYDMLTNDGADTQAVLPNDVLIPISVDSMVFRKNAGERQAVKRHKIPDKMMTVLGVKNADGDIVPATIAELQGQPKKKTWSRKKKVQSDAQPAST